MINLVFLVDVSGSMMEPNKLPLVKSALKLAVDQMGANDHLALVTYAGNSRIALEPTSGSNKAEIVRIIDSLEAGGGTHGSAGIEAAYDLAQKNFQTGAVNRVVLATDGDFNIGTTRGGNLARLIQEKAARACNSPILASAWAI